MPKPPKVIAQAGFRLGELSIRGVLFSDGEIRLDPQLRALISLARRAAYPDGGLPKANADGGDGEKLAYVLMELRKALTPFDEVIV